MAPADTAVARRVAWQQQLQLLLIRIEQRHSREQFPDWLRLWEQGMDMTS